MHVRRLQPRDPVLVQVRVRRAGTARRCSRCSRGEGVRPGRRRVHRRVRRRGRARRAALEARRGSACTSRSSAGSRSCSSCRPRWVKRGKSKLATAAQGRGARGRRVRGEARMTSSATPTESRAATRVVAAPPRAPGSRSPRCSSAGPSSAGTSDSASRRRRCSCARLARGGRGGAVPVARGFSATDEPTRTRCGGARSASATSSSARRRAC